MPLERDDTRWEEITPTTVAGWDRLRADYRATWGRELPLTPAEEKVREEEAGSSSGS